MANTRTEAGRFIAGRSYSPATQFKPGQHPALATEIQLGQRLSPATEFKPGMDAHNRLPIGSVRVRRETHTGLDRAWVKTAEPNVWRKRAVLVWEAEHGPVPRGLVIHHRDRDSLNDAPANLQALTRKEHADEHRGELKAARARSGANFACRVQKCVECRAILACNIFPFDTSVWMYLYHLDFFRLAHGVAKTVEMPAQLAQINPSLVGSGICIEYLYRDTGKALFRCLSCTWVDLDSPAGLLLCHVALLSKTLSPMLAKES